MVDAVAVQIRAGAVSRRDSVAHHAEDRVEFGPREVMIWPRPSAHCEKLVFRPIVAGNGRDDLLRQNIQGRNRHFNFVQPLPPHSTHECQRFEQFVAGQRKEPAFRHSPQRMPGATDALQKRRDRSGRPDLAHEVDVANVDSQLQRRRGDDRL